MNISGGWQRGLINPSSAVCHNRWHFPKYRHRLLSNNSKSDIQCSYRPKTALNVSPTHLVSRTLRGQMSESTWLKHTLDSTQNPPRIPPARFRKKRGGLWKRFCCCRRITISFKMQFCFSLHVTAQLQTLLCASCRPNTSPERWEWQVMSEAASPLTNSVPQSFCAVYSGRLF